MSKNVGAGLRPARWGRRPDVVFGIKVISRELWETGKDIHLDRFISPRAVTEITGGPGAPHNRIHTSVPAGRKYWRNYLA